MRDSYPLFGNGIQSSDDSQDIGAKLGFWGAAISTLGDALQTIGAAISIEEGRIADQQQQQELEKLQTQIDELKKAQSQTNTMSPDAEMFRKLVEKLIERLEIDDNTKSIKN